MSAFISGMDSSHGNKIETENGAVQLSTSGEALVDLFFNLVRSTPKERVHELVDNVLSSLKTAEDPVSVAHDLVVAMFHCRATRSMGKGERKIFVYMLVKLHAVWPKTIDVLVREIPFYGCWKDLLEIVSELDTAKTDADLALRKSCLQLFAKQINKDLKELELYNPVEGKEEVEEKNEKENAPAPRLSFAAKWAPREKKTYDKKYKVVDEIAKYMFPAKAVGADGESKYQRRKMYRNAISKICKSLNVPEIYMSAKKWSEINFKNVPSVCLNKLSKAFLNEKTNGTNADTEKGNRYPEDLDRVACRKNMIENLTKGKINSKQLFPHEVVRKCMAHRFKPASSIDSLLCKVQWEGIRESVLKSLEETKNDMKNTTEVDAVVSHGKVTEKVDLGKLVPLVDVSGSMSGEPMEVAIALGILISEIAQESFRDRVITFESNPRWHVLNPKHDITQKVKSLQAAPWGGSTSIEKALELIYHVVRDNKLSEEEVPDMIVFSDMQFDVARGGGCGYGYGQQCTKSWQTTHEIVKAAFNKLGMEIAGKPYSPPRIIYWNIRGNSSSGIHAPVESDCENVQMLSGYSPALMKLVLAGEMEEEVVEQESVDENGVVVVTKVKKKTTPYDTFRKAVDDGCFDRIRELLNDSKEGIFAKYVWSNTEDVVNEDDLVVL